LNAFALAFIPDVVILLFALQIIWLPVEESLNTRNVAIGDLHVNEVLR
jgi:hypothetical protein